MRGVRDWLQETPSAGFELRRHFFLRFFDSDLVSTPGQWQVVAGGVLAVLLSLSIILTQAYYHKYQELNLLNSPEPLRRAALADVLFLVTLAMFLIALFTTLQWPSLFPGLPYYLALGALPVRLREVFIAKFSALVAFGGLFIVATTFLPSVILPLVMAGRHATESIRQVPAIFVSSTLAARCAVVALATWQGAVRTRAPTPPFTCVALAGCGPLLRPF